MKSNIISSYLRFNRKRKQSFRLDDQSIQGNNPRFYIYYNLRKLLKQINDNLDYSVVPAITNVSTSTFSNFIRSLAFAPFVRRVLQFSIIAFLFQTSFTLSSIAQNKPKDYTSTITGFTYTRDDSTAVSNHLVRLKNSLGVQIDSVLTGNSNQWQFLNVPTDVKSENYSSPASFALYQNYPNPFNPHTTIRYEVSSAAAITIDVFDIKGEKIITLANEYKSPGRYELQWNANTDKGTQAAEGVYIVRMIADGNQIVKKMIFLHKAALQQGTASFTSNKYYQENSIHNEFDYTLEVINLTTTNPQIVDTQFTFTLTRDTTINIYASQVVFETVNVTVSSFVEMMSDSVPGKFQTIHLKQNGNVLQTKSTGDSGCVIFSDVIKNKSYTISVIGDTASRPNINAKDTLLFIDKDTAIVVNPGLYLRAAALNSLENKTFNEDEFPANPILHDLWTKATGYDSLGNQAGANAFQYLVLSQTNPNLAPVIIQANQYTKLDSLLSDGNGPNNVTVKAVAPNNMSDQKGFSVTVSPKTDRKGQLKDIYGIPREGYIFARNNQGQQFIMQTDAQGRFAYQMNNGISWDSLKAQIKNDVRPSEGGFIRAMYFQNPSDLNDINVVAVPHLAGADYIGLDTLDSFIKEANFNHPVGNNVGKLKKADLNNLLDFISSTYSGLGTITLPEQDYIINNIGQRIDPYFNIPSAKWKVPQDSVMTSPKDNAINWFKDPNGALGSISTRDADGDGILERANIRLLYIIKVTGQDTIRNNLGIVQEGLSARVAPGEVGLTSTIPASKTVLHAGTGAPGLMLQPADIWLVKICESYPALTPHGDILKKGNYQQEFDEQIGSNSGP